ncbi:MAG: class II glutamine amidotransferase, partial [Methanobacteriaceae archaeon]|nr:class II glutamine amidotransferase [Methanobacteriaceae archaeon]
MQDKCGIVGVYSINKSKNVSREIYYGLYALQHRGQESAGISSHNGREMSTYRGMGLVCDVFKNDHVEELEGNVGIGHVRYSTTGKSLIENSQPFVVEFKSGKISIAHNGDIINSMELRKELEEQGTIFHSTTDSEVLCHLLTNEYRKSRNLVDSIQNVSKRLLGSYSLVILLNNDLIVVRDPIGIKPLSMGKTNGTIMFASETVAFDAVGAQYVRDVEPGE